MANSSWWKLWGKSEILAKAKTLINLRTSSSTPEYDWATNNVVDVQTTRGLYYNNLNRYALSAYLCKPMINSNVSFIDKPEIVGAASDFLNSLDIPWTAVHTMSERDGDCFVWVQWNTEKRTIEYVIVPPEKVTETYINPETKEVIGYKMEERFSYNEPGRGQIEVENTIWITNTQYRQRYVSGVKNFDRTRRNPLGFVPIVQFSNARESFEERGHSEFENILSQLKLYHDMTMDAGHAQHTDGHPKISVEGVEDVGDWLNANFGEGAAERVKAGESLSMDTRDLFVTEGAGAVKYLQRGTPTGDYVRMAEIVFNQLVEGSETPEVNFGANMGTSLASVKEQRPVWNKRIERKQAQYDKAWDMAHAFAIRIANFVTFNSVPTDFDLYWKKPDFRSENDNAELLEQFSKGLGLLKSNKNMSDKEIYNTLNQFDFIKLEDTFEKHKKEVAKSENTDDNNSTEDVDGGNNDDNDDGENADE